MTESEREEIIGWLVVWTGWRREAFLKYSNRELLEMADRYNKLVR